MLIILPNLKHSFISMVPVPIPDSGSRSRFPAFLYALPVADRYISYSNGLIIFTAYSSKLSSITVISCTYKLFFGEVTRFLGLPIS